MCDTCGCGSDGEAVLRKPGEGGGHCHASDHDHHHHHGASGTRKVEMEQDVLHENNLLAERNRGFFEAKRILTLNFLSSPGSGKTALLEKTIPLLKEMVPVAVIEGDQQTTSDADRIDALGVPVIQVNTGTGCHLDARMINRAVRELPLQDCSLLCIENVGNLVCPAMFDLGEAMKIVVISVTEGDDKPLKYPYMFHEADVCILNKTDLLPYVDFDASKCRENAMRVSHGLEWFELSVKTGEGVEEWVAWLEKRLPER
ncbi:MAG: hydrogenase nickel incorporation protein HypB [Chlorobium sp.]|jgi:hydrogenase nickel incorporation protein HypB|uniref:hydrogenase nickel incorporation protein HypB n=1 Tax=Chlorobium sp. TaxID=1095 RepID=UPI001D3843F3|nr:hydrogenase nickel incorporation protein HypB [Chlorobium sp.]MBN1278416.1 hydrogenase nickel incorporation protein HypB [Chlorobiaceae bacterium]MCF8216286.1 hydrogenase nickel incorporation protein HypB [Chlorobium sp.]MCF8271188.1 hydrogenase nickel incorporation protein HypB [Chlorobium sp.]MCF8287548.1 hydrogenase nickel incorporation protein HypB [Chlorobium sp.]MCF8291101.1 hydrogenase nickel incorporation protein HypB [Chlorobium sp.]